MGILGTGPRALHNGSVVFLFLLKSGSPHTKLNLFPKTLWHW